MRKTDPHQIIDNFGQRANYNTEGYKHLEAARLRVLRANRQEKSQ